MEGPCLVSKERGSLSSPSSLCVSLRDLNSLVIHKAQLPALNQEMLLSNAPHLAATEQIQVCSELDSRKRQGSAICLLREGNLPLLLPHKPQQMPSGQFPPLPHAFHFPLISLNQDVMAGPRPCWSWASLRDCIMSALPWRSEPIRGAMETFPHISAFWGGTATTVGRKGQGGSKA